MTKEAILKHHMEVMAHGGVVVDDSNLEFRLRKYGLPEYEVELILDKFISRMSNREIAEKQGYTNHQYVGRLLAGIIKRLKKSNKFKELLQTMNDKEND